MFPHISHIRCYVPDDESHSEQEMSPEILRFRTYGDLAKSSDAPREQSREHLEASGAGITPMHCHRARTMVGHMEAPWMVQSFLTPQDHNIQKG